MSSLKAFTEKVGMARFIIGLFLLFLLLVAPVLGLRFDLCLSDTITRFGMYSVLILSLVPMIQSGCSLNFGIPLGIVAGVFGSVVSLNWELKGFAGIFVAMVVGVAIAAIVG